MYVLTLSLQFATLLEQSPDFFSTLYLHYPLATIINQLGLSRLTKPISNRSTPGKA